MTTPRGVLRVSAPASDGTPQDEATPELTEHHSEAGAARAVAGPRDLLREAGSLVGAQVAMAAIGLVAIRAITEILDPITYGAVALILAGLGLAKGLFLAPWLAAQLRLHPEARTKCEMQPLYRSVVGLGLLGTLVGAAGLSVVLRLTVFRGEGVGWSAGLLIVAAVWLAADGAVSLRLNYLNAELQQGRLSALRVTDAFLRPAAAIGAVLAVAGGALLFVAGQTMGAFLLAAPIVLAWSRNRADHTPASAHSDPGGIWRGPILRYGAPLIPLAVIQWVIHLADRYILEFYHGSAEVGLYAAAYVLASQPFLMLSGVLSLAFRPRLFRAAGSAGAASTAPYLRTWLRILVAVGGIGLLLLIAAREAIGRLLLAEEYRAATGLIPIVGAAYLLLILGQGLENGLMAEKRTPMVLLAGSISMVVSLTCALRLIPRFGSSGAAWATLFGLAAYAGAMGAAQLRFRATAER